MNWGSTLISSFGVMCICSLGIWILNNFLMEEITGLRSELDRLSSKLRESEEKLNSITSQQSKLEKTLNSLNSAEKEIGKLREGVASLAEDVGKFHSMMIAIEPVSGQVKTMDEKLAGLSSAFQFLGPRLTDMDQSMENLEKCFHCPCDFDRIVDSCYFIQRNKLLVDFEEASKICQSKNASLVTINSNGEFNAIRDFLIQIFNSQLYSTDHGWLTGARRVNGVLTWTATKMPLDASAIVWGANEPSNEECVTFFPTLGRNMNLADISCEKMQRQFICEL
ncbi:C-type lectin domain family 4 member M-like [Liolophura sinensis]|uniref:C-type lectin domain family 4 member M-like n=1 Tax=Liolophura sinensis TaxID=3198878 RepID=UPI003159146C